MTNDQELFDPARLPGRDEYGFTLHPDLEDERWEHPDLGADQTRIIRMRHNRNTFFHELTPLANGLKQIRDSTPQRPSTCKDVPALLDKRKAKLARRAASAGHIGPMK